MYLNSNTDYRSICWSRGSATNNCTATSLTTQMIYAIQQSFPESAQPILQTRKVHAVTTKVFQTPCLIASIQLQPNLQEYTV